MEVHAFVSSHVEAQANLRKIAFLQQPMNELDAAGTSPTLITNQSLAPRQTLLSTTRGRALGIRISCIPVRDLRYFL